MKPGNRPMAAVPIPAGFNVLKDEEIHVNMPLLKQEEALLFLI